MKRLEALERKTKQDAGCNRWTLVRWGLKLDGQREFDIFDDLIPCTSRSGEIMARFKLLAKDLRGREREWRKDAEALAMSDEITVKAREGLLRAADVANAGDARTFEELLDLVQSEEWVDAWGEELLQRLDQLSRARALL